MQRSHFRNFNFIVRRHCRECAALALIVFAISSAVAQEGPGNALQFPGTGGFIQLGAPDLPPPWTATLWVNRQNAPGLSASLFSSGNGALKLEQFSGTRKVGFTKFGAADYVFNYSVPAGSWTHLAFVGTPTGVILYVNGVATDTNANSISLPLNRFGGTNAEILNAQVDEVTVWNTARTPQQIQAAYSVRALGIESGLQLLWHFDEPTNAGSDIVDSSLHGHEGNLSNGVVRVASTAPFLNISSVVTNPADPGPGSLREAVSNANCYASASITFDTSLSGQQIILNSELALSNNVVIDGSALAQNVIISGNHGFRIFNIQTSANVSLNSLTLINGKAAGAGGSFGNRTGGTGNGGGIYNAGLLTLNQITMTGNSAVGGAGYLATGPGGIGQGGGIYNAGTVTLNACTLNGNSASGGAGGTGAGVDGADGGVAKGGSIYNAGMMTLNQCTLTANSVHGGAGGAGAGSRGGDGGDGQGGGIFNLGTASANKITLTGNSATGGAGGGSAGGASGSPGVGSGGGVFQINTMSSFDSILSGNSPDVIVGSVTLTGHNLTSGSPLLSPLGANGGPTPTMPPLPGSPALDTGTDSATNLFSFDQRGLLRLSGSHVDVGAVEGQYGSPVLGPLNAVILANNSLGVQSVQLSAMVSPGGASTTVNFAYGKTTAYGTTISEGVQPSFAFTNMTLPIDLSPGLTVHWRVTATNNQGGVASADQSFNFPSPFPAGDLNQDGAVSADELGQVYSNYLSTSPLPQLTGVTGLGGPNISFAPPASLSGGYTVQTSTNLIDWTPLGEATLKFQFTDTNTPIAPQRFYRLVSP